MTTFLKLCQNYASEIGMDEGIPSSVDGQTGELAQLVKDVRNANREIQLYLIDWRFRRKTDFSGTVSSGVNDVTIGTPSSGASIIAEYDRESFWMNKTASNAKQLTVLDYEDWRDHYYIGAQTNGEPDYVVVMPDNALKVHPVPDGAYTITADYFRRAVDFSASGGGNESSVIPSDFHRLIELWAMLIYAKRESAPEYAEGSAWERDYLIDCLKADQAPDQANSRKARTTPQAVRVL